MQHAEKSPLNPTKPDRRYRKRQQTANLLAQTAFRLFEAYGYDAVTMDQIAREADMAKGTLYNAFPVKEALLAYYLNDEVQRGLAAIQFCLARQTTFIEQMHTVLHASAQWNQSRRGYLPHYLRYRMRQLGGATGDARDMAQTSGVKPRLELLFLAAQRRGEVRSDIDAGQTARTFEFMCVGAVLSWLSRNDDDLARRFDSLLDLLMNGIAARPAAGGAP